jgi:hypothetical protein
VANIYQHVAGSLPFWTYVTFPGILIARAELHESVVKVPVRRWSAWTSRINLNPLPRNDKPRVFWGS